MEAGKLKAILKEVDDDVNIELEIVNGKYICAMADDTFIAYGSKKVARFGIRGKFEKMSFFDRIKDKIKSRKKKKLVIRGSFDHFSG